MQWLFLARARVGRGLEALQLHLKTKAPRQGLLEGEGEGGPRAGGPAAAPEDKGTLVKALFWGVGGRQGPGQAEGGGPAAGPKDEGAPGEALVLHQ